MVDLLKAFALFTFGFVILANLGDALDKKPGAASSGIAEGASFTGAPASVAYTDRKEFAAESEPEQPSPATKPVARSGTYAQVCATFDPIAHPEHVIDILEYASGVTGTPVDVLYAIWRNETGHVDGAGKASGTCDVMGQLKLRCEYGRSCKHETAMRSMAETFRWDLQNMTCSCGTATWGNDTRYYGGCCGPFQFSGAEIVDNALSHGLDPMSFCGGSILAGWELKGHHDRYLRKGDAASDTDAWRKSISRYFGADRENKYWRKAYAQWSQFHDWYARGSDVLRQKVAEKSAYSAKYHRGLRAATVSFASN